MSATDSYRDLTRTVSQNMASLRTSTPGVMKAFGELGRAATAPGVLETPGTVSIPAGQDSADISVLGLTPGAPVALATRRISPDRRAAVDAALGAIEPALRQPVLWAIAATLDRTTAAAPWFTAPGSGVESGQLSSTVGDLVHRARSAVRAALAPLLEDPAATPAAGGCPDLVETFSRHLEGEIGPEMCAAMERHLEGCPRCRGQCDALRRSLSVCRSLPAAPVPPAVQRDVRRAVRDYLGERSR